MLAYSNKTTNAYAAAFKKKPINVQYQSEQDPTKQALGAFSKQPKPTYAAPVPKPAPIVAGTGIKGPTGLLPGASTPTNAGQNAGSGGTGVVNVDAQSQELASLADQMAKARTSGDMGTLAGLTTKYSTLVQSMQKQVAAAPAGTGVAGQPAGDAAAAAKGGAQQTAQGEPAASPPAPGTDVQSPEGNSQDTGGPNAGQQGATTGASQQKYQQTIQTRTGNAKAQLFDKSGVPSDAADSILNWMAQNNYAMPSGQQLNDLLAQSGWTADGKGTFRNASGQSFFMGNDTGLAVLRDWSGEATGLTKTYNEQGKYEDQLQTMMNTPPPGSTVKITDLPQTLQDEYYREAMDALKNGKDPKDLIGDYLSYFDQNNDFNLKPAGYTSTTDTLHDYTKTAAPGVGELGAADTSGITGALAKATQTDAGNKAMMMSLDALTKRLQGGGAMSDQDFSAAFSLIDQETAANVSATAHDLANAGQADSGTTAQQLAAVRQQGTDKKSALVKEMLSKQMEINQQDFQQSVSALTGIAKDEADRLVSERGQDITAQTSSTELQTRREEVSKTLFQEGQLTIYSTQVEENLKEYGMSLEKYQTDKGFDEAGLDRDLKERIAQAGLTEDEAKLKYQQVKDSIDFAMQEKTADDKRNTDIAGLEQKAAQGDQDANYRIQALKVEQDLRDRGMTNEQAQFNGKLMYDLLNNREERSQQLVMFYEGLKAQKEMQGSPFLDFLGQFLGVGATIGAKALKII